ncbi:MAG TPA: DUF1801 domain-containing protein [Mariprofundaceae bacterium]|nr:DUF1801 domain-containing protein [Mariprofundaceae bacterium]
MNNVLNVIEQYPKHVQTRLLRLRELIFEVAKDLDITDLEETLKWGEPSYITKHGSTLRFDWKAKKPNEYALYFNCKTRLVEIFREFYADELSFEDNRAVILNMDDAPPEAVLKHCIQLALTYHKIKHLPTLGV